VVNARENAVADEVNKHPGPFDVSTIEFLVALMSKHDISEIDLREGAQRIHLRRGLNVPATALPAPVLIPQSIAPTSAAPTPAAQPTAEKQPARNLVEIKSPTIGTFYAREKPEAAPYVTIGARVSPNTVVGLIEAMKLFSEIPANCSGVVTEILVENGQPVEYNQVLFRIDPSR
jgi:acetyl-CoA carboxylase biotin carboxyl carrier protein